MWLIEKYIPDKGIYKAMAIALSAAIVLIAGLIGDKIESKLSTPKFTVKTTIGYNEIDFIIKTKESPPKSIIIDYPINGVIVDIQELHSLSSATTTYLRSIEGKINPLQSNFELKIEDIFPSVVLTYKIFIKPTNIQILSGGRDRYKLSYTWDFKGHRKTKEEWRLLKDDSLANKPNVITKGLMFSNDPNEDLYRKGIKKRDIKDSKFRKFKLDDKISMKLKKMREYLHKKEYQNALPVIDEILETSSDKIEVELRAQLIMNKGVCHFGIGIKQNSAEEIKRSINCYQEVIPIWEKKNKTKDYGALQSVLATSYSNLANFENRTENLNKAINHWTKAIKVFDKQDYPDFYITIKDNISKAKKEIENSQ